MKKRNKVNNDKSVMEIKYDKYLVNEDRVKILSGEKYYMAVSIDELKTPDKKLIIATFPYEMFEDGISTSLKDENGNEYSIGSPGYSSFSGCYPKWYLECGQFELKRTSGNVSMGSYFHAIKDEQK